MPRVTAKNINPGDFPMKPGESWWIVSPNNGNAEFNAPVGSWTICTEHLLGFNSGTMYEICDNETNGGWITVGGIDLCVRMPYYVFARYFDAECFVRGRFSTEGKVAVPFHYKTTLERFEDK